MLKFFTRLPDARPEDYVRQKHRRRALTVGRSGDDAAKTSFGQAIRRAASTESPPLPVTDPHQQISVSTEQRAVIEERQRCALETLEQESPLADGERIEEDFFSYLSAPYAGLPAGTAVLRRRTDRAEICYVFDDFQITDAGDLQMLPPPAFTPSDVAPPRTLAVSAGLDTRKIFNSLASGLASGIGGKIGALIFDAVFPPGVPSYFDEVYKEIERIVDRTVTQNTVDTIDGKLNGIVLWLRNTYRHLKEADPPESRKTLTKELANYLPVIHKDVVGPLMQKHFEEPGFSVFMVAAGVHLGLIQEQALVDPRQPDPAKSPYAQSIKDYVKDYAAHAERVLRQLVAARREKVTTKYDAERIIDESAAGGYDKPAYRWKDLLTGERGKRYPEHRDKDKGYHSGREEADRDREIRRGVVENALRRDLGTPTNAIAQWRKLITAPLPKV